MIRACWTMLLTIAVLPAAGLGATDSERNVSDGPETIVSERPWETIDVAIALDTSGSMDRLIETARVKLWEIVQDLTLIEPTPTLRVALLTFGNSENPRETGWVKVEAAFTTDLDLVSERLFDLSSDGGMEYIGRVLQVAFGNLSWTPSDESQKLLFVVGNEPADQDPKVALEDMADVAREAEISLHVIFCGQAESENAESWRRLAELAGGEFATIDHRSSPVLVDTPYDAELVELSSAINRTYIPLGEEGLERKERLEEQDEKIRGLNPAVAASRAGVKSSRMYSARWDLVDAVESGRADIDELEDSQLPEEMRAMGVDARAIHVQDLQTERRKLRERVVLLSEKRRQYVAEALQSKGIDTSRALDTVLSHAIREKLEASGFSLRER